MHCTVDLLVLTNLVKLDFILKILFTFYKTRYLNMEDNCSESSDSVSIYSVGFQAKIVKHGVLFPVLAGVVLHN